MRNFKRKVTYQGMEFDSRQEKERYIELRCRELRGEIGQLHRQVRFTLIRGQWGFRLKQLKTKVRAEKYEVEKPAYYTADFVYREGVMIVIEDVKSPYTAKLQDYVLRRKLMVRMIRSKNERYRSGAYYMPPRGHVLFVFREAFVRKNGETIIKNR